MGNLLGHPPSLEMGQNSGLKDVAGLFLGGVGHPEPSLREKSAMQLPPTPQMEKESSKEHLVSVGILSR